MILLYTLSRVLFSNKSIITAKDIMSKEFNALVDSLFQYELVIL